MASFEVCGYSIGDSFTPIVVAELGINHGGDLDVAIQMADAAINSGVRFIKHQTHIPDAEMSEEAKFVIPGNAQVSIYEVISSCTLSEQDEYKLMKHVQSRDAVFFSTPFSREAADRLSSWDVPLYKIGSGECNNYPLVRHIAEKGKPVILSTGMNTISSIQPAVDIFEELGTPYALLHTTNLYPTPSELLRLGGLSELKNAFPEAVIGLSDHSLNNNSSIAAVALGASILERHFTDSKKRIGPDIICSMDPDEASQLLIAATEVKVALGGLKGAAREEEITMAFAFSSVVALKTLNAGDVIQADDIWVKRPSGGDFGPQDLELLVGKTIKETVHSGYQIPRSSVEL